MIRRLMQMFSDISCIDFHELVTMLSEGEIFDAGCGDGKTLDALKLLGKRAVGMDISLKAIKAAHKKRHDCVLGDLEYLPFRNEVFHTIISLDVIEHLRDPIKHLKECYRICRHDGAIYIHTPNRFMTRLRMLVSDWKGWDPTHIQEATPRMLRTMLLAAGFHQYMKVLNVELPWFVACPHFVRVVLLCAVTKMPSLSSGFLMTAFKSGSAC